MKTIEENKLTVESSILEKKTWKSPIVNELNLSNTQMDGYGYYDGIGQSADAPSGS
jgi:hypothetical protein